ncbi:efflux RND transporter periplasmic adaptor subunit [Trinickia soli]|uniref:efflux RND transporter periplasmic adaptor subunit n=1 Tax=Trinickia soli TaxID=380675 RepID=UPI003FA3DBD6
MTRQHTARIPPEAGGIPQTPPAKPSSHAVSFPQRSRDASTLRAAAQRCLGLWVLAAAAGMTLPDAHAEKLATYVVEPTPVADEIVADATIESTRQTSIAAQISGRITGLYVKAGDRVNAGQRLLAVDQRAADQQLAAVRAQAAAARAELDVARRELERTQYLFDKQYVSQAALDRANARYQSASSMTQARLADAGAAAVGPTLHNIAAPYAATIASVDVELGSMAMPGMPLITLFDPGALRAVATVPQARAAALRPDLPVRIELPDVPGAQHWQTATSVTILPVADALSASVQVRLSLPASAGVVARPGMYARAHFLVGAPRPRLMVPLAAVVRRTEVTAVYVVASNGSATLRQVRLGETRADRVEVLAGLSTGERIALDPLAATNNR